jgi:hypothetical protein
LSTGRKHWRLVAIITDDIAHDLVSRINATRGASIQEFGPVISGPVNELGAPTERLTGPQALAQFMASHTEFTNKMLAAYAGQFGISKMAVMQALNHAYNAGLLKRIETGRYKVVRLLAEGERAPNKYYKPKKANGAKPPKGKRIAPGAGEAAAMTRLARANGAAVSIDDLRQAVVAAGGRPKSISGIVYRLSAAKKIKHGEEKGTYRLT